MAARNNRDHVIRNLLTCFETAARKVGVDQLFKFGAYDELRREQAVRLSALTVSPLNELWTEIGKFMASSDVTGIKPTEWRSAVLLFIGKNPMQRETRSTLIRSTPGMLRSSLWSYCAISDELLPTR